MSKKESVLSLSVSPDIQKRMKQVAERRNTTVSGLLRGYFEKLHGTDDESVDTIVIKVPKELKSNPEELEKWLQQRFAGIVKALTS